MSELTLFLLIAVVSIIISSVSQLLLKLSANKTYDTRLAEYANPLVMGGYLLIFVTTVIMVVAYRVIPLSIGPILEALGYVFIAILGFAVLKEKISRKKLLGMALIVVGVIVSTVAL